ncbi:MAG: hypothetical protein HMLKMBBP_02122 [Planctomycetes bacterium]|nr:hypothetical protein [Planctomycetota bacterium]
MQAQLTFRDGTVPLPVILGDLEAQLPGIAAVRLRAALVRPAASRDADPSWIATHWVMSASRPGENPVRQPDTLLPELRLIEREVRPADAVAVLDRLLRTGEGPDFSALPLAASSNDRYQMNLHGSTARRGAWRQWGVSLARGEQTATIPTIQQIAYGSPPILYPAGAACRWLGIRRRDADLIRIPSARVEIPETRCRIVGMRRIDEARVEIDVERRPGYDVAVEAHFAVVTDAGEMPQFRAVSGSGAIPFDCPAEAPELTAALISAADEVLDCHRESPAEFRGVSRVLDALPGEEDDLALLSRLIAGGEGEGTEFKPGVKCDAGSLKREEVFATVCAFANRSGGYVLLGVSNDGVPDGIEAAASSGKGRDLGRALESYRLRLCELVRSVVEPEPAVDARVVQIAGRHVLMLKVAEHPDKPCHLRDERRIVVRTGASNMAPSREWIREFSGRGDDDDADGSDGLIGGGTADFR